MKDEHINAMLDRAPLEALSESEQIAIQSHADVCAECRRALGAARVSSLLLKSRAVETVEPSPFFQTRVLAALRERQSANEAWSLGRLWRSAGVLFSTMAATVAALAALTFVAPQTATQQPTDVASAGRTYSAEDVILGQSDQADEQMSYGQVMNTLYAPDENAER
jgi:anti-sigma-K factor RskA